MVIAIKALAIFSNSKKYDIVLKGQIKKKTKICVIPT